MNKSTNTYDYTRASQIIVKSQSKVKKWTEYCKNIVFMKKSKVDKIV